MISLRDNFNPVKREERREEEGGRERQTEKEKRREIMFAKKMSNY